MTNYDFWIAGTGLLLAFFTIYGAVHVFKFMKLIAKIVKKAFYKTYIPANEAHHCHAGCDGECTWEHCPQIRDGEPEKSGRHCPLDYDREY